MSLGDPPICARIATTAGSYLVTYLDTSQENRLQITSLWTIENLLDSLKSRDILLSMEIIAKLLNIYTSDQENEEARECAGQALSILSSFNSFKQKDLALLLEKRLKDANVSGSQFYLKIIFESGILKENIGDDFVDYLINFALECLRSEEFVRVCYAVRVLGNLFANGKKGSTVIDILEILGDCSINECLKEEVLWMLKNFYNR